eukprot:scaffold76744_cov36-Prasinocladus_malaysianus.AAC.2
MTASCKGLKLPIGRRAASRKARIGPGGCCRGGQCTHQPESDVPPLRRSGVQVATEGGLRFVLKRCQSDADAAAEAAQKAARKAAANNADLGNHNGERHMLL